MSSIDSLMERIDKEFPDLLEKALREAMKSAGAEAEDGIPLMAFSDSLGDIKEVVENMSESTHLAMGKTTGGLKKIGMEPLAIGALLHLHITHMSEINELHLAVDKLTALIADKH